MIHVLLLLVFSAMNTAGVKEGDHCIKGNIPGVCTNIRKCPDAQQDIKIRKPPQICEFKSLYPIVCCVTTSSDNNTAAVTETRPVTQKAKCVLPPYLDHGNYVANVEGRPGDAFVLFVINITCSKGYGVHGSQSVFCQDGWWPEKMPTCERVCQLTPHPSVDHSCIVSENGVTGTRECNEFELHGTVVNPRCKAPIYSYTTALKFMHCVDGSWDYYATCIPECGTVTPDGEQLVIDGVSASRGEVPWHAGIYTKAEQPYMQICGGSLISTSIVISAAHCFWDNIKAEAEAESNFAIAVGKLYRPWNNQVEFEQAQRSDVKEIHIPARFQGRNFQDDIAVVIVSVAFQFKTHIRPVCVDFDINFERRQLQPGKMGTVAGWGLTAKNGDWSQVLKVVTLPFISIETCIAKSPPDFREFITSDKICAGVTEIEKVLCRGSGGFSGGGLAFPESDRGTLRYYLRVEKVLCRGSGGFSGGGLAFPESDRGTLRYYLRGVVSTAPTNELCDANILQTFTQVLKHEHFIKEFWKTNL